MLIFQLTRQDIENVSSENTLIKQTKKKLKTDLYLNLYDNHQGIEPELIASHNNEQSILSMKYSPADNNQIISCGKENIRYWRLSKSNISSCAVALNHYARNSVFTVFDFSFDESGKIPINLQKKGHQFELPSYPSHIIVGAKLGMIFQINYITRELEMVYKLHDSAICSISIRDSFCVTGSEDQYVRLWPLNFSEFLLECKQDSSVISLEINKECTKVVVGSYEGALSILDLEKQTCRTFLSAVSEEISIILKIGIQRILTLGSKNVISVFDGIPLNQSYEFECGEQDECTSLSAIDENRFLGGFRSGVLRIFDINKLSVIVEKIYHKSPITHISTSTSGKYAVLADNTGTYSLLDIKLNFEILGYFEPIENARAIYEKSKQGFEIKVSASVNKSENALIVISRDNKSLNLYGIIDKKLISSIWMGKNQPHTVLFSNFFDKDLFVLTCERTIQIYDLNMLDKPLLFREITMSHEGFVSSILPVFENRVFITTGGDGKLKMWGIYENSEIGCKEYHFHSNPIYTLTLDSDSDTIYSAGGQEGIYIWDFRFDKEKFLLDSQKMSDQTDFENERKVPKPEPIQIYSKNALSLSKVLKSEQVLIKKDQHVTNYFIKQKENDISFESFPEPTVLRQSPMKMTDLELKNDILENHKNVSEEKEMFVKKSKLGENIDFLKVTAEVKKQIQFLQQETNEQKFALVRPHYQNLNESAKKIKTQKIADPSHLKLKNFSGINTNSSFNMIWNIKQGNLIYIAENKLIIEEFSENRLQKVFHLDQYLSCIHPTSDFNHVFIGTVAPISEINAPIYILNLIDFTWAKIEHHKKGVQNFAISSDSELMLSIGIANDKKMMIYSLTKKKIIYESFLQNPAFDCFFEKNEKLSLYFCGFTTKNSIKIFTISFDNQSNVNMFEKVLNPCKFFDFEVTSIAIKSKNSKEMGYHLFLGTSNRQIHVFDFFLEEKLTEKSFKLMQKIDLFSSEVCSIKLLKNNQKLIAASEEGKLTFIDFEETLKKGNLTIGTPKSITFESQIVNFVSNFEGDKGIVVLKNGNINFYSERDMNQTQFVGNISREDGLVELICLDVELSMSIHQSGKAAIWRNITCEKLCEIGCSDDIACGSVIDDLLFLFTHRNEIFCIEYKKSLSKFEKYICSKEISTISKVFSFRLNQKIVHVVTTVSGQSFLTELKTSKDILCFQELVLPIEKSKITDISFAKNGMLAVANHKNEVNLLRLKNDDSENWHFEFIDKFGLEKPLKNYDHQFSFAKFDPKGEFVFVIFSNYNRLIIYDIVNKSVI